jgi:hypothetical protein
MTNAEPTVRVYYRIESRTLADATKRARQRARMEWPHLEFEVAKIDRVSNRGRGYPTFFEVKLHGAPPQDGSP